MKPQKSSLASSFAAQMLNGIDSSESSDDEDFVCNEDESLNSEESTGESDDSDDEESQEESEENSEQENPQSDVETKNDKSSNPVKQILDRPTIIKPAKLSKLKQFNICCVCLNEESDCSDELVSCDSCGFCTHEGCYGINDNDSKQSSDSSASTEPWFCNSCLVEDRFEPDIIDEKGLGCFTRNCELCPNKTCGLLKETENGKFVHIICALYTSGIAYQWPDRLWPVVLNEIPITNWGEHVCTLCDDIRYSRTGVCIKCDAGMCKNYFHATCAQKHGLLVDPFQQQNTSDPFIAYCKTHNDPDLVKSRKSSFFAMISSYKSKNLKDKRLFQNETEENKKRLIVKFKRAIEKYEFDREKMVTKPANVTKTRLLTTCPQVLKCLIDKNKLNSTETINIDQQNHSISSITFTPDFVKYYFERESKIPQCIKELEVLKQSQIELTQQEAELRNKYETSLNEQQKLKEIREQLLEKFKTYSNLLELVLPKQDYPREYFNNIFQNDNQQEQKTKKDSKPLPIKKETNKTPKQATPGSAKRARGIKNETVINNLNIDASCVLCTQKINPHLLIDCDTCKNAYHINCLDPPLSSVPKKTRLYGWECAKCVLKKDGSSDEESIKKEHIEDESSSKRTLRRERKQRVLDGKANEHSVTPNKRIKKINSKLKIEHEETQTQESKHEEYNKKDINNGLDSSIIEITSSQFSSSINNNNNNMCSDSEAIYIHDDESESPKGKQNSNLKLEKSIRAFKSLPVEGMNDSDSSRKESEKSPIRPKKPKISEKDEIENSNKRSRSLSQPKSQDTLDEIIESVIKSPNIQPSRKHQANRKNKI